MQPGWKQFDWRANHYSNLKADSIIDFIITAVVAVKVTVAWHCKATTAVTVTYQQEQVAASTLPLSPRQRQLATARLLIVAAATILGYWVAASPKSTVVIDL